MGIEISTKLSKMYQNLTPIAGALNGFVSKLEENKPLMRDYFSIKRGYERKANIKFKKHLELLVTQSYEGELQ